MRLPHSHGISLPSTAFFCFFICLAGERERSKGGCEHIPLFVMPTRGYPPFHLLSLGKSPFLRNVPLFVTLRRDIPLSVSKRPRVSDHSMFWLLWHAQQTTSNVETTSGPYPGKRGQHVSIRDVRISLKWFREYCLQRRSCATQISFRVVVYSEYNMNSMLRE